MSKSLRVSLALPSWPPRAGGAAGPLLGLICTQNNLDTSSSSSSSWVHTAGPSITASYNSGGQSSTQVRCACGKKWRWWGAVEGRRGAGSSGREGGVRVGRGTPVKRVSQSALSSSQGLVRGAD
ncbi:hypothetical protein E2C01_047286 [Portunus trituberculatus]|uniref:Uncharacterized protein n=1 Tax=Portunus trituberculatus TaxID=210409 RepID=A0A5B7G764_PORTR|nr:hypothetical protein [Portunus trituberculatus]